MRPMKSAPMKCAICRNGNTDDGFATVLLEREGTTLVYKHVSAKIRDNCGEETIYISEKTVPAQGTPRLEPIATR
uniref:Uncharacterized protein n=1 Tax=Candidatus Kentrum sp. UNK TaxID=2126344 RepID=A0A451AJW2_9GAMM|nr:MAG: hypothetical protein BECKUNK1418G_GA0071005_108713 [Candidatus Kentron sp. UNK]VFK71952.1 MAG: hypothetical protein BECKUNK1418H_GA0071006_108813 [Candidatus Kentron sp. UNK]